MRDSDQGARQVLINEDLLRQILEQVGASDQLRSSQAIAQRRDVLPDEYTVVGDDSVRDDELAQYADDGIELDLNRRRNEVPEATFGSLAVT